MEMSRMSLNVSDSITARLAEKLQSQVGHRADLHISDYAPITANTAKVLIGYNPKLGKPDATEVEAFAVQFFGGEIVADTLTARNYPGLSVISCIMGRPKQSIPLKNKPPYFTALAGDVAFLDAKLGHVWDVESEDGEKFLTRKFNDNIEDILKMRYQSMRTHAGALRFSDLPNEGEVAVAEGYEVLVYHNGAQKKGVVASVQPSGLRIRLNDDKKMICATPMSVIEVTAVDAASESNSNKALRDFYLQFMSKEMVDQMYPEDGGTPKFSSNK